MGKLASSLNERLDNKIGDSKFKKMFFKSNDATGGLTTNFALKKNKQEEQSLVRQTENAQRIAEANKPPEIPIRDGAAEELAKKRSYAGQRRRSGRLSTILSNNTDSLG